MYKCADTVPFDVICPRDLLEGLPYTVGGKNKFDGANDGTQANDLNKKMDAHKNFNKISIHNVDSDTYIHITKWLNDYSRLKRYIYKILNAYNRQDTRTWRWTQPEPKELEKYNATGCVLDYRSPYANEQLPANYVKDMETPALSPLSTKARIMTILFEDFCDTRAAILQCHVPWILPSSPAFRGVCQSLFNLATYGDLMISPIYCFETRFDPQHTHLPKTWPALSETFK